MNMDQTSTFNKINIYLLFPILFFFTCFFLSAIIPPFQSPDEFDHIKRAYFLSGGKIILATPNGQSSGGEIDSGLSNYMGCYNKLPFKTNLKLSAQLTDACNLITWTNKKIFSEAPGTGYYFPIIYLPQAIGLFFGEKLSLSIDTSYLLARLIVLIITCFIIFYSFLIYSPSPLIIALLCIPMSLFQFSSASLDGLSTSVSILALSIFMRITTDKEQTKPWFVYLLAICVLVVASCRMHLLPLLLLIPASFFYTKNKNNLILSYIAAILILIWIYIAMHYAIDNRVPKNLPLSTIFYNYIVHPKQFIGAMLTTLSDANILNFYSQSFIGILGWLDISFPKQIYTTFYVLITLITLFSISSNNIKKNWPETLLLIFCSLSAVFLIFFLILITWNTYPAHLISGVQGRYFLIPMLMIAYSFQYKPQTSQQYKIQLIGLFLVLGLYLFSVYNTTQLLIYRYYLANKPVQTQE